MFLRTCHAEPKANARSAILSYEMLLPVSPKATSMFTSGFRNKNSAPPVPRLYRLDPMSAAAPMAMTPYARNEGFIKR